MDNEVDYASKIFDDVDLLDLKSNKNKTVSMQVRQKGNKLYANKGYISNCFEILICYCKSIAFAPSDSEELALGFSNRSSLMLDLKKYDLSIIDADRSLKVTKSAILKAKLLSRKARCLKLMGDKQAENVIDEFKMAIDSLDDKIAAIKSNLFQELYEISKIKKDNKTKRFKNVDLEIVPAKQIPCASDAVHLNYSDNYYGRHVKVNKDVKTGDLIAMEEPYATFPYRANIYVVCSYCLRFSFLSIPCENCTYAMYCSEKCRSDAWTKYHDCECLLISSFFEYFEHPKLTTYLGLIVRIAIIALKEGGIEHLKNEIEVVQNCSDPLMKGFSDDGILDVKKFRFMYSLIGHEDQLTGSIIYAPHYSKILLQLLKTRSDLFDVSDKEFNYDGFLKNFLIKIATISNTNSHSISAGVCTCFKEDNVQGHKVDCKSVLGEALTAFGSLLNHSCAANIEKFYLNGKMVLFANRPIKKNEQCFVSYGPNFLMMEKEIRQEHFVQNFSFKCHCIACKKDWCLISDSMVSNATKKALQDKTLRTLRKKYDELNSSLRPNKQELFKCVKQLIDVSFGRLNALEAEFVCTGYRQRLHRLMSELFMENFDMLECFEVVYSVDFS